MVDEPAFTPAIMIEDRVFNFVRDLPMFTFKDVRGSFPNEADKTLYRAINKLESQRRIQFMGWHAKQKLYSCTNVSQLPCVLNRKGDPFPSSIILKNIKPLYREDGQMDRLAELNEFWILIAYFYVIAQMPDEREKRQAFFKTHRQLLDIRNSLMNLVGTIDSLTRHPAMGGDMEYFQKTFGGNDPEMPTAEEITEFKLWLTRFRKGQISGDAQV